MGLLRLPGVFDGGARAGGIRASTEAELEEAMAVAGREREKLALIEARLAGRDCSPGLRRLGETFLQTRGKK